MQQEAEQRDPPNPFMLLLCVAGLVLCLIALPFSLAANRNEGTPGTFTADEKFCDRASGCEWLGSFESDDGQISEVETMSSDKLKRSGDQVEAQKVGESIYHPDSKAWIAMVGGAVGCFSYVIWFVWARRRWRRLSQLT